MFDFENRNEKAIFPFVSVKNKITNYNYYPIPFIQPDLIAIDEKFIDIVHCPICPNVMPDRYMISNYGRVWDKCYNRQLASSPNDRGYYRVKLVYYISIDTLSSRDVFVSRLVAYFFLYFFGCENLEVNHKNGDKAMNIWWNLEWCSPEYNKLHAQITGLIPTGEDKPGAMLTNDQTDKIGQLIYAGKSNKEISLLTGIDSNIIHNIRAGKSYKHISIKYDTEKTLKTQGQRLTDDQVHKACQLRMGGMTCKAIADIVCCNEHQIKDLLYSGRYSHITKMYNFDRAQRVQRGNLSEDIVHSICKRLEKGESEAKITNDLGLRRGVVNEIKRGKLYTSISSGYNIKYEKPIKLTEDDAHMVCKDIVAGLSTKNIMDKYGYTRDQIIHIKHGTSFPNVRKQYPEIDNKIMSINKPLDENTVRNICTVFENHPEKTSRAIAKEFGIGEHIVQGIRKRNRFPEITKDYNY